VALGIVIGAVGLAACGMSAQPPPDAARSTGSAVGDGARSLRAMRRLPALAREGADHPLVRAFGLNPNRAVRVAVRGGIGVAKVADSGTVCLVIGDGNDQCFGAAMIGAGRGYAINNDCSAGARNAMRIVGVAPARAVRVIVRFSSGPGLTSATNEAVFALRTTTPDRGDPVPVAIEYTDPSGSVIASDAITGQDLCLRHAIS
jgi:hypothetical protein